MRKLRFGSLMLASLFLSGAAVPTARAVTPTAPKSGLWVARYDGPGAQSDSALAEAMSPDGSTVYVTGWSTGTTSYADYATVAYDAATGAPRWLRRFNGPADGTDVATAIATSPDGTLVFVTGHSDETTYGDDAYATFAYDAATGSVQWEQRYDGPAEGLDEAYAMAVSPDGSSVFVTGKSYGTSLDWDVATVAYDTATGSQRWVRRYDGPAGGTDIGYAVGVSPDGSKVFVAGSSRASDGAFDWITLAYDAGTGAPMWSRRHNGPVDGYDEASALAVSPDGSTLYVTGYDDRRVTAYDYVTIAYDTTAGTRRWLRRYTGPVIYDYASSVAVSPDGSKVFVTGQSQGDMSSYDYVTVGYDAITGSPLWYERFNGPGGAWDQASRLAITPDGSKVYVTGWSTGPTDEDYTTLSYAAASGALLDVLRYDGPDHTTDQANFLVISPDGSRLFVTGGSWNADLETDYATVAYEVTP